MKKTCILTAFALAAAFNAACLGFEHKSSLEPTGTGISALMGSWTSSNLIPSPSTCTDFTWNVTQQTDATASGSFSATCANDLKLTGTAQGTLAGSGIVWSAQGNATAPGLASCAISLTGAAEIGVDTVRVQYSGDTCLGKVDGVENLKRR